MSQSLPENEPAEVGGEIRPAAETACWRCGLQVPPEAATCPHCHARNASNISPVVLARSKTSSDDFGLLFGTYAVLLVVGLVHALVINFTAVPRKQFDREARANAFLQIIVVEAVDTVIVAVAILNWRRRESSRLPALPQAGGITAWVVSVPLLGGLLLVNLGYHALLRELIHAPLLSDQLTRHIDFLAIVAICLQPAIVEEVYCRWFALDCLRGPLGMDAAVWISATMFGFLHVAVLPSVPYLILLGAFLGYMRLVSGSLLLPMLLHFAHNFIVLIIEGALQ
jgi:membrane protease YdiL (CAAX protease family)